ncbi:MAG TPA: 5'-3' exonuclease H3TH domain-containing protein [Thermoanaerobaculia bacterium]
MTSSRTVHLIDASPYIFRAFFSLPESLKSRDGRPAGAVYGFASFLLKLVADERPTHLGVAFDRSLTTSFRNRIYPPYKAQRALPPPELEEQLRACEDVAAALGAATFIDDLYEADDLIGTLVARLEARGHGAIVITSDKDMAQLVSERVTLYDFGKSLRLTPAEVEAKLGVRPDQVADLLGLAGDPVDNIPGVPGVGRKTAATLLAHFGHVEDLYARLLEVARLKSIRGGAALAERLAVHRDLAFLSKELATVARDAPLTAGLDDLEYLGADREAVDALFDRMGFGRIRARVPFFREEKTARV